jgi:hypothetical protein
MGIVKRHLDRKRRLWFGHVASSSGAGQLSGDSSTSIARCVGPFGSAGIEAGSDAFEARQSIELF